MLPGYRRQAFSVTYHTLIEEPSNNVLNTYPRSGNPGYLVGRPILAGGIVGNKVSLPGVCEGKGSLLGGWAGGLVFRVSDVRFVFV